MSPPPAPAPDARPPRRRLTAAVVTFALASLIAAVVAPRVHARIERARLDATATQLRSFAAVFQAYATSRGEWPRGDASPGAIPAGMQGILGPTPWTARTPLGGRYAWDTHSPQRGGRYRAVILLATEGSDAPTADRRQLQQLDARIDDGNLATGKFFLGFENQPVFVLEH